MGAGEGVKEMEYASEHVVQKLRISRATFIIRCKSSRSAQRQEYSLLSFHLPKRLTHVVWQVRLLVQPVPEVHQVLLQHFGVLQDLLAHALQLIRRWSFKSHRVVT